MVDKEVVKKALDDFENDRFSDAKDALTGEIRKTKDAFLKSKLGLKDWGNPPESNNDGEEEEE